MQMGFLGGLTVAGLILLAALTGVVLVKMTTASAHRGVADTQEMSSPFGGEAHAAVEPHNPPVVVSAPAMLTNPLTGQTQYGRNCNGAVAEAKTIGVLPGYAKMNETPPRVGQAGENICSAVTQSAQWDIAFYSRCRDGGESCPVLARVTQQGQYVVFSRE
jgi:hypothetical protein